MISKRSIKRDYFKHIYWRKVYNFIIVLRKCVYFDYLIDTKVKTCAICANDVIVTNTVIVIESSNQICNAL